VNKIDESELVWRYFDRKSNGVFVDIGANHPTKDNQTWFLETQGWTGVLIEPNPHLCQLLREQRPKSLMFQVAIGARSGVDEADLHLAGGAAMRHSVIAPVSGNPASAEVIRVKLRSLNQVMEESGVSKIDFLSIDVEGIELEVLGSLNFSKYRPQLVSIEDFCENFEKKRFMRRAGYKLIRRLDYNTWYVPQDAAGSAFSVSTPRELMRLIRKDFLSIPFVKLQKAFKSLKRKSAHP
jgi:FkbM family methyltransferase